MSQSLYRDELKAFVFSALNADCQEDINLLHYAKVAPGDPAEVLHMALDALQICADILGANEARPWILISFVQRKGRAAKKLRSLDQVPALMLPWGVYGPPRLSVGKVFEYHLEDCNLVESWQLDTATCEGYLQGRFKLTATYLRYTYFDRSVYRWDWRPQVRISIPQLARFPGVCL